MVWASDLGFSSEIWFWLWGCHFLNYSDKACTVGYDYQNLVTTVIRHIMNYSSLNSSIHLFHTSVWLYLPVRIKMNHEVYILPFQRKQNKKFTTLTKNSTDKWFNNLNQLKYHRTKQSKINYSLTVDFDGTFWASCSHFIGGFDGKFTSWGTIGTGNDEGIKSIRILGDFEAGTLGDIGLTFPPGNGRSWQAVDLSFQYKLMGENHVSKLYLNSKLHNINQ